MPSHFRLMQATELALHHGSLEGIDALLGNTFGIRNIHDHISW